MAYSALAGYYESIEKQQKKQQHIKMFINPLKKSKLKRSKVHLHIPLISYSRQSLQQFRFD